MKITSLDIPEGYQGLKRIRMRGLGDVVLLAGPNGGGKSRVLEAVGNFARAKLTQEERSRRESEIENNKRSIEHYASQLNELESKGVKDHRNRDHRRSILNHENQIEGVERALEDHSRAEIDRVDGKPIVVDYRVNKLDLRDSRDFRFADLRSSAASMASEFNVGLATEYGLSAIHDLMDRHVHANSSVVEIDADRKDKLNADVARLKILVKELLLTELNFTAEQGPLLFGRPINEARLSSGQKVLLQILMSLFFQDGTKEDLILLLDEPENHLHPLAVLQLVDRVRSSCPHAQIWIATHSLNLLAHFDNERVWFVKEGEVEHAGSKPLEVLHSLVGGDAGIEELSRFLALPAKNAALGFAAQCMIPPSVLDTNAGDPQTRQIYEVVKRSLSYVRPLRVLDMGMGKGRLLSELVAQTKASGSLIADDVDYIGFDPFPSSEDSELCRQRLKDVYADGDSRYISDIDSLRRLNRASIRLAVMCNVLHEITPGEWVNVFGKNGYLTDLLHPDGHLLIVEDQLLKFGERAHAFGFLVLNSVELRSLFDCEQEDSSFITFDHPDEKYAQRLKAHLVPAAFVGRVTVETTNKAIAELQKNAYREVKRLQGEQHSFNRGREYAFWTHQYVNAVLASGGERVTP